MTPTRLSFLTLIPALGLLFAACGNENTGATSSAVSAIDPSLVGTYGNKTTQAGALNQLVLKTDGGYHLAKIVSCSAEPSLTPCEVSTLDGHFKPLQDGAMTYLKMADPTGLVVAQYEYQLANRQMRIRDITTPATGEWQTMVHSPYGWCAATSDCSLQNLTPGRCEGAWACGGNVCSFACNASPPALAGDPKGRPGG